MLDPHRSTIRVVEGPRRISGTAVRASRPNRPIAEHQELARAEEYCRKHILHKYSLAPEEQARLSRDICRSLVLTYSRNGFLDDKLRRALREALAPEVFVHLVTETIEDGVEEADQAAARARAFDQTEIVGYLDRPGHRVIIHAAQPEISYPLEASGRLIGDDRDPLFVEILYSLVRSYHFTKWSIARCALENWVPHDPADRERLVRACGALLNHDLLEQWADDVRRTKLRLEAG